MSGHSPGPWRWSEDPNPHLLDATGTVVMLGVPGFLLSEEDERLIVAAPELLHDLSLFVDGCTPSDEERARMRALIARISAEPPPPPPPCNRCNGTGEVMHDMGPIPCRDCGGVNSRWHEKP